MALEGIFRRVYPQNFYYAEWFDARIAGFYDSEATASKLFRIFSDRAGVPHSYAYRHLGHEPVAFIVFLSCADRLVDPAVCYSPFAGDRLGHHWVEGISCGAGQSGFQLEE